MTKVRFWPWRRKICNTGYLQSVYTAVYSAVSVQTGMWPRLCTCQRTLSLAEDLKLAACLFQKKVFLNWPQGKRQKLWQPARGQGRLPWWSRRGRVTPKHPRQCPGGAWKILTLLHYVLRSYVAIVVVSVSHAKMATESPCCAKKKMVKKSSKSAKKTKEKMKKKQKTASKTYLGLRWLILDL